jgi:hypothetical protein
MPTLSDLGQIIRRISPERWEGWTDEEIGRATKQELPGQYEEYTEGNRSMTVTPPPERRDGLKDAMTVLKPDGSTGISPLTVKQVEEVRDYYSPHKGIFSSWLQRIKADGRGKLLDSLYSEQLSLIERGSLLEDKARKNEKAGIEYKRWVIGNAQALQQLRATSELLDNATEEGLTLQSHQELLVSDRKSSIVVKHEQGLSKVRLGEVTGTADNITDNEIRKEKASADVRMKEAQNTLNLKIQEQQEIVRLAIISKTLTGYQETIMIQGMIDKLYRQIDKIKVGNFSAETKRLMIEDRERIIGDWKRDLNARNSRLFSNHNG